MGIETGDYVEITAGRGFFGPKVIRDKRHGEYHTSCLQFYVDQQYGDESAGYVDQPPQYRGNFVVFDTDVLRKIPEPEFVEPTEKVRLEQERNRLVDEIIANGYGGHFDGSLPKRVKEIDKHLSEL